MPKAEGEQRSPLGPKTRRPEREGLRPMAPAFRFITVGNLACHARLRAEDTTGEGRALFGSLGQGITPLAFPGSLFGSGLVRSSAGDFTFGEQRIGFSGREHGAEGITEQPAIFRSRIFL